MSALLLLLSACGAGFSASEAPRSAPSAPVAAAPTAPTTRVYAGHADQPDPQHLVAAWPTVAGTRLDDCRTCHTGWPGPSGPLDTCDGCHLLRHPPAAGDPPAPTSVTDTLNPFGRAYLAAGRSVDALRSLVGADSDGDGALDGAEIAALRFPGDPESHPGQPLAPTRTFSAAALRALPPHDAFVLVNTSKDVEDVYATYGGVRVVDLLVAAGVDPAPPGPTGVTVFAADGYAHTLPWSAVTQPGPATRVEPGLDRATLGERCGWVRYPDPLPVDPPAPWLSLGWARDGQALTPATFDEVHRLRGEGPYRLVVPNAPGEVPDRGGRASPSGCPDGRDFAPSAPHNAGAMVRGVVAVRVDPMPEGVEPVDLAALRTNLDAAAVTVFGLGVRPDLESTP